MKIYLGNVGKLKYIDICKNNGYGICYLANHWMYPKEGISWFLDNGAFHAWKNGKPFDEKAFLDTLNKLERCCSRPDFIVCPDIVAAGKKSLDFSLKWLEIIPGKTEYPFTEDIQHRADLVENAVMEAVNQQGKQSPIAYKQLCESSMTTIRSENLDTEYNYNTLDASQKELIQSYRVYLQEAADVVVTCYTGETPDLTKMEAAKAALN